MIRFPFKIKKTPKNFLGIDIGTSSIRVVELGRKGQTRELKNYGEIKIQSLQKSAFRTIEEDTLLLSDREIARAISAIMRETGIQTREVNFSIPDFASFFTNFELPPMSEKELPQAIRYEARSYIPLPLSEITLDWSVVQGDVSNKAKTALKILVVAIPNEIINQYQKIASFSGLEMKALEAEAFALARSSITQAQRRVEKNERSLSKNEKRVISVIDIGARSTTCNILEKGILKISHSFNLSGNELTEVLSRSLKVGYEAAEELKGSMGLIMVEEPERNVREILLPLVDSIISEIKKIFQGFYQQEGKGVEKVILAGATALLPGLKEYFAEELKKEVEVSNPFEGMAYPPILEETLKEMGPAYTVAVGLALKGLE